MDAWRRIDERWKVSCRPCPFHFYCSDLVDVIRHCETTYTTREAKIQNSFRELRVKSSCLVARKDRWGIEWWSHSHFTPSFVKYESLSSLSILIESFFVILRKKCTRIEILGLIDAESGEDEWHRLDLVLTLTNAEEFSSRKVLEFTNTITRIYEPR